MVVAGGTDRFERRVPAIGNALDIFAGRWLSRIPGYGDAGIDLFNDHRVKWIDARCGGFVGMRVLELGPLEGGHTYMAATRGASEIVAIEANVDAYLRCLVARDALGYRARFLLGDFTLYLDAAPPAFDLCLCMGVLYHMNDPLGLLERISRCAARIGIWTHFYEEGPIRESTINAHNFGTEPEEREFRGSRYRLWPVRYNEALARDDFAGGVDTGSRWLELEGITNALEALGYTVTVGETIRRFPHGPCSLIYAEKAELRRR